MTYAISDIHGEYEKYMAMLEKIQFCDEDTLFIIGDVIDRGSEPIRILQDMMQRPNVYPLMGNHELMGIRVLKKLAVEITEENYDRHLDDETFRLLLCWMQNGCDSTLTGFQRLPADERMELLAYLEEFSLYEAVDVGERTFILVHAGLGNFRQNKKWKDYTADELLMMRSDPDAPYFDDESIFIVSGHTPTLHITGKPEIYFGRNSICIDCGACFPKGRLGCICLDTLKEFYV